MIEEFLSALPMPAVAIDSNDRMQAVNVEAQVLLGQGLEGRHYVTILRQPALARAIEDVRRDGVARTSEYYSNGGAEDISYQVSVRMVADIQAVLLCFTDVSHLEQAGQMRRDFVANVSHELRTPLTSLIGFIETLRGPARGDAAARDRFLDIMEGEAERMNRLIRDLLSLSRVEDQQRVRPRDKIVLNDILGSVVRALSPLAAEAAVELHLEMPDEKIEMIGDSDQLQQVFTNLIENAIKYGASGGAANIEVQRVDREPALRAPAVRVQVIDFGPGIDAVHLPRLTERFYRADSHRSRVLGGTGLGLAIVKHIINRHRGRLRVESTLGEGAQFTVILPLGVEQME